MSKKAKKAAAKVVNSPEQDAVELREARVKQANQDEKAVKTGVVPGQVPVHVKLPDLKAEGYDMSKKYINRIDNQPYYLKVDKEAVLGRTHMLKNLTHYWEGSEEDFKDSFDKD